MRRGRWPPLAARDQIQARLQVLDALLEVSGGPAAQMFHASIRVADLPRSTAFSAWLLNRWPKEWTHRYATSCDRTCR